LRFPFIVWSRIIIIRRRFRDRCNWRSRVISRRRRSNIRRGRGRRENRVRRK
jgi:hypothetical protein